MELHPLADPYGKPPEVSHACPECELGHPRPFCPVCLGAGLVSAGRLARYELEQRERKD